LRLSIIMKSTYDSAAFAAACAVAAVAATTGRSAPTLAINVMLSGCCYVLTSKMAIAMRPAFIKARLFGIDLNKPETKRDEEGRLVRPYSGPQVPEAMGVVAGTAYLAAMFCFIPFAFLQDYSPWTSPDGSITLSKFLCALLAICCMCFLGFADNVLDLRWRDKLWLPLTASLPLLMVYAVDGGGTVITVPTFLSPWLGSNIDIGLIYYGYMAALAIFCTNSINILAGVNGLEVGQSVVIAVTIAVNNCIQLWRWPEGSLHDNNLFSLCLIVPFIGASAALLVQNWHPAEVFVGDTYCYFAGMTFAVVGILGHNAKTIILFFIPQVINFLYSCPQLFKLIPCPRHRMPAYLAKEDKLQMSFAEFNRSELGGAGRLVLRICEMFHLAKVETGDAEGQVRMSNMTIINFVLFFFGPMHERRLTSVLLLLQLLCSCLALLLRYQLAGLFYEVVR